MGPEGEADDRVVAHVSGGRAKDQVLLVGRQGRGRKVRHPHRFPRCGRKSRQLLRPSPTVLACPGSASGSWQAP